MEMLLLQLKDLPKLVMGLPKTVRVAAAVLGVIIAGAFIFITANNGSASWQYAFTNLTPEDSVEAAQTLKNSGIAFRMEAGGAALAVPSDKVYDARLLLASAGLPRGGGVGFELFDRGDLGTSEFTQKINLRRAIEGELARTIGRLTEVRSARIHLSLAEKGLFRDEDRRASAAVVLNLQPGRALGDKELAGIRHLVASAVPGLSVDAVTVVDGRGATLSINEKGGEGITGFQRKLEREMESRVVTLLEPVVGQGSVVARVTAEVDTAEVTTNAEAFDPDGTVLRSERRTSGNNSQDSNSAGNVAGAAANQPLLPVNGSSGSGTRSSANNEDEVKNYEVSKTITTTVQRQLRLKRLSVAVLVDGLEGKARAPEEVTRLGELAKRAVGFDEVRGDQFDITSASFTKAVDTAPEALDSKPPVPEWALKYAAPILVALGVLIMLVVGAFRGRTHRRNANAAALEPGRKVGELEARAAGARSVPVEAVAADGAALPGAAPKALLDPGEVARGKARNLAATDPRKAAHLLRAWIATDAEGSEVNRG